MCENIKRCIGVVTRLGSSRHPTGCEMMTTSFVVGVGQAAIPRRRLPLRPLMFPTFLKKPHETEVLRTACNDIPRAILPIDVQPPPKPRRAAIAVPRVCQPKRVTVFSGGLEGDSLISADEDALANCCKSPALGWTPAIQVQQNP